ncbi:Protein kinase domain-containing protein [Raphanus sativus]|nr:Protein kinase domain-containing protein [Raphanus sativus]
MPGEDLDALISVRSDEDLLHMIEEYQEAEEKSGSKRIRVFLVSLTETRNKNINQNSQHTYIIHYHHLSALKPLWMRVLKRAKVGKVKQQHNLELLQIPYDLPSPSSAHKRSNTYTSYFVNPYGIYDNNFPFMVAPNLHGKW